MGIEPRERYIDPYTDFGFKKLFGTELNKDLLISFLNALFNDAKREIKDVQYLNAEQLGDGYGDRRAVFDVYCVTEDGSRFIVEMQKAEQEYFKDRSVYYATAPIREQAPKGKWDYHLDGVYTIGVLNFVFPDGEYPADSYIHEIKLKDTQDNHVFYDKLTFVYLEMPKFNKREDELETMFDKWMFALRNLSRQLERPAALQERIFKRLFDQAEIAQFSPAERREYAESVKDYWDYYSTMKTAHKKGKAEGREEGLAEGEAKGRAEGLAEGQQKEKTETVLRLKALGLSIEQIAQGTGLTADEVTTILS
ncbi:MAG: Rpn family recombination-promoting nuclease/putative transposase [Prevotella sp.]|nr:Rpn family recombination-promoting nuclease/putative transposase [Prevotella sp.]